MEKCKRRKRHVNLTIIECYLKISINIVFFGLEIGDCFEIEI